MLGSEPSGSGSTPEEVTMRCLFCKKYTSNKKFCNNKCQGNYRYSEHIIKWKQGEEIGIRIIRKYLFTKYNFKCCRCGWSKINNTTGRIPLEIEHLDGNSDNNCESNLELLCPNCHSLTSTFRALNKGNGRFKRRQRFLAGKSF